MTYEVNSLSVTIPTLSVRKYSAVIRHDVCIRYLTIDDHQVTKLYYSILIFVIIGFIDPLEIIIWSVKVSIFGCLLINHSTIADRI